MEFKDLFDVAIVGASLGGSSAAISLAEAGLSIALFDSAKFPRHKPCGEGLSHFAFPILKELGVSTAPICQEENQFYGFQFLPQDPLQDDRLKFIARSAQVRGCGVSRTELDSALLSRICDFSRVRCFLNEAVSRVERDTSQWIVSSNRHTVRARYLIFAHGAQGRALIPDQIVARAGSNDRLGYSMVIRILEGQVSPLVSVLPFAEGEVYVTPLKESFLNVSLVGSQVFLIRYRKHGEVKELLRRHLGIESEVAWCGAGSAHFEVASRSLHPALYLVGDASQSFDPACGLGMTHALLTARLVSRFIIDVSREELGIEQAAKLCQQIQSRIVRRILFFSWIVRRLLHLYRVYPMVFVLFGERFSGRILDLVHYLSDPTRVVSAGRVSSLTNLQVER